MIDETELNGHALEEQPEPLPDTAQITRAWERYARVLSGTTTEQGLRVLQTTYFSGALAAIDVTLALLKDGSPAALQRFHRMHAEVTKYFERRIESGKILTPAPTKVIAP